MIRKVVTSLWMVGALLAQSGTGPGGHWEGAIQLPNGELAIEIDLAQDASKNWIGTISIPAQNTKGMGLTGIAVKENTINFGIKAPGNPQFTGQIDKEAAKITGEMMQSGTNLPFKVSRAGEAKIEKPIVNPPLSKELEGTWEGALSVGDKQLRLRFILSNQAGAGTGIVVSLDQGNVEIPITRIEQTASHVKLDVPIVTGGFEGELKGTEIAGQWTQGGNTFPLKVTKAGK